MPSPRERFLAFRQSVGRAPRLTRRDVVARGLTFAVWESAPVPNALPLLCVNGGLLFDHAILWPALAPLATRRQIILYDQRGRGASQSPPGLRAARIEHDGGDVAALRVALGIDRWDVLGHSWGGGIAMLGVSEDTDATRRLVLIDPVGVTGDWLPRLHDAALTRLADRDADAYAQLDALDPAALRDPDPAIHVAYQRAFYPAWFADAELASLFVPPRLGSPTGAAIAARLRRDGYDWTDRLRALSVPSLVLHGEQDLIPVGEAERTVALLPDARLERLADAGHMPFWEAAEECFALVESFLDPTNVPSQTPAFTSPS